MMFYSIELSVQAANSRLLLFIVCSFFVKHLFPQGNAIGFDGLNDRVVVGYSSDLQISGDLTLETWVNFDGVAEDHMLLSFGRSGEDESRNYLYSFRFNSDKTLLFFWEYGAGVNQSVTSSASANINAGEWHHLAVVRDALAKTVTFYLDGSQLGAVQTYTNNATGGSAASLCIACDVSDPSVNSLDGEMDEVRIWNKALAGTEINTIYNDEFSNPSGSSACLKAYYQMTDGSGTSLTDDSGNGNTGTLQLGPFWTTSGAGVTTQAAISCSVLPVELVQFTALSQEGQVELQWETATELNNAGFDIQNSADGRSWKTLAFVPGAGTAQEEQSYRYIDERPLPGLNYYRLKQIDYDGQFEYSKVVAVQTGGKKRFRIYPNPAAHTATLSFETGQAGEAVLRLYNAVGQAMRIKRLPLEPGANRAAIALDGLLRGAYLVELQAGAEQWRERLFLR